jgi:hypothetical protein
MVYHKRPSCVIDIRDVPNLVILGVGELDAISPEGGVGKYDFAEHVDCTCRNVDFAACENSLWSGRRGRDGIDHLTRDVIILKSTSLFPGQLALPAGCDEWYSPEECGYLTDGQGPLTFKSDQVIRRVPCLS